MKHYALVAALVVASPTLAQAGEALLPDIRPVVPSKIQLKTNGGREVIRLTSTLANTGAGPWQMRGVAPTKPTEPQKAIQEVLDASGAVVQTKLVSEFEYHPEHNHFHTAGISGYEVRRGSPTGVLIGNSEKVGFCLIDHIKIDGNSPSNQKTYWDCDAELQGISVGWLDQYHQPLEGQGVDVTGATPGKYYMILRANPNGNFLESNKANNVSWAEFTLARPNGKLTLTLTGKHSPCSGALCGVTTNR